MPSLQRLGSLAALAATLAAVACGESTSPTTSDPSVMAGAISGLNSSLSQNALLQSLSAISGNVALAPLVRPVAPQAAPGTPAAAAADLAMMRALAGRAPAGILTLFPANVLGKVFQWDTATHQYRITDSNYVMNPPPSATGVRFILYQVDTATHQPRLPLATAGYVDLVDESTAQANVIHIVVQAGSGRAADYRVSEVRTTSSDSLTAFGYVQDVNINGPQITFTLTHVLTLADSSLSSDYEASGNGASVSLLTTISGSGGTTTLTLDWIVQKSGSVQVTGTITQAVAGTSANVQFKINGGLFATMTESAGGSPVFTGASGQALTAPEMLALGMIVQGFLEIYEHLSGLFGPAALFFT